jgi:threonine synthase
MRFYSTNSPTNFTSLKEAVLQGLAPDNGLYMPETIPVFPPAYFQSIHERTFREMALAVASAFASDEVPAEALTDIVDQTLQFDAPLVEVEESVSALELFHGPTMAFKDFGARFMSQLLRFFSSASDREVVILVATSGDTGSAVANGFLGVPGIRVVVLYPSQKVSDIQEKQFTTLGGNITAVEVLGTFDDCQRLVKQAFLDRGLQNRFFLTSANSINIARLIPQSFYYFYAYAKRKNRQLPVVFAVPSGNFGNLTGGLLAKRMGLPVEKFIAATNVNDVVPQYLITGKMEPRASKQTISNAMDVGNPSNFARLMDLYGGDVSNVRSDIKGYAFTDEETAGAMRSVWQRFHYLLDPHGAIGYLGLKKYFSENPGDYNGIFLETAHPAKFTEVVENTIGESVPLPETLQKFVNGKKEAVVVEKEYEAFKSMLLRTL